MEATSRTSCLVVEPELTTERGIRICCASPGSAIGMVESRALMRRSPRPKGPRSGVVVRRRPLLHLIDASRPFVETAVQRGITAQMVCNRRNQSQIDRGGRAELSLSELADLSQLCPVQSCRSGTGVDRR